MKSRKRSTAWARYQAQLIAHPVRMQIMQAALLAVAANIFNQCFLLRKPFSTLLVTEQLTTNIIIAPITIWWLTVLRSLKLHWVAATLVDQLAFSVVLNIFIFYFIAAVFRGGISVGADLSFVVRADAFPSLRSYEPIWSTRVQGLKLKLPTTLVRELMVPVHLKGVYELGVRFVWSVVIAAILARWKG